MFWPCHGTCGILVPQPGIKPIPCAVEVQSPNHWTTREALTMTSDIQHQRHNPKGKKKNHDKLDLIKIKTSAL